MPVGIGESGDHVDGDVGPWFRWDSVWVEWGRLCLVAGFGSLTSFTASDVRLDIFLHLRPPVLSLDKLPSLFYSWVSSCDMVVILSDYLSS